MTDSEQGTSVLGCIWERGGGGAKGYGSDDCPCGTGPQTPNHNLQSCPIFDSLRYPQEALGTGRDTATDCGLCLTHRTENPGWPGPKKKKKAVERDSNCGEN